MDDLNSVRCKACDTMFNTRWIPEQKRWEDMCSHCILASEDSLPEHEYEHAYLTGDDHEFA